MLEKTDDVTRFFAKIDRNGPVVRPELTNCWIWTAGKDWDGYGAIKIKRKQIRAHRLMMSICCGEIPAGLMVLHHCDNPSCVRPEHLFLGTSLDNSRDCVSKGRQVSGDAHHYRKNPELRPIGDRNGSRTCPESRPRGDSHFARKHPEKLARGSRQGSAKLTEQDVMDIREAWANGANQKRLAEKYGIDKQNVWGIIHRKSWKHVP